VTEQAHDRELLGAYALGGLDSDEARAVDDHIAGCPDCRRELADLRDMRAVLGEVPPEAFLDGPADAGDLLLRRTLGEVGRHQVRADRRRYGLVAAGIVALVAVSAGAGVLTGRDHAADPRTRQAVPVAPNPAGSGSAVPGTRGAAATNPDNGSTITATVIPAAGWVRVHARVAGIKAGTRCQLIVVPRAGTPLVAGSWLVSPKGERDGTSLDGAALVTAADVVAIEIVTFDNVKLVSAPL
jgi:anti-sigma factor RsiW